METSNYTQSELLYRDKDENYFAHPRNEILIALSEANIDLNGKKVLDLGCGNAAFKGTLLKHFRIANYQGVDFHSVNNELIKMDLDNVSGEQIKVLIEEFDPDVVFLNDVLEHLLNGERLLKLLRDSPLKSDILLIISLPNIRFYPVLKNLLFKGDFKYENSGVLDKTHLRFYTAKSFLRLVSEIGLKPIHVVGINAPKGRLGLLIKLLGTVFKIEDTLYPQYLYVLKYK